MPWRRRKNAGHGHHGGKVGQVFKTTDSGKSPVQRSRLSSFAQRTLYYMRGHKVHKGLLRNGHVVEGEPVKTAGSERRTYVTARSTCPELTPSKAAQRSELAAKVEGGTILETHAGKGNLSGIYAKKADKLVLVDKNKQALNAADKKLSGKVSHQTVCANNLEWLKNEMPVEKLRNLKLVDFDPFGCPSDSMKTFFERFPVKHRLLVAVTDGSKTYLGYHKKSARRWLKTNYGIDLNAQGSSADQIRVLDSFMQVLGRHHHFKVRPINAGFGKKLAVYAGYELSPQ